MIKFSHGLNRYYDTKTKRIVSRNAYLRNRNEHRFTKSMNNKINAMGHHNHPSYKKLYLQAKHELAERPVNGETKFHPFLAHRTKDGMESPIKDIAEVREWLKHHTSNLFVIAALDKNNHDHIVRACGTVDELKAAGFGSRYLVPELIDLFEDGYND